MPLRRSALSVCPCGNPWWTPLQLEISYSWAPVRPPRGQTLRLPRPKVTSVLTRLLTIPPFVFSRLLRREADPDGQRHEDHGEKDEEEAPAVQAATGSLPLLCNI